MTTTQNLVLSSDTKSSEVIPQIQGRPQIKDRRSLKMLLLFVCSAGRLSADMVDTAADLSALPSVPAGYTLSLFAKEPLVQQPCSMAFDARGRLFIGMGPQYRNPTPDTPGDSVCIIEDTNHDGTADSKKIFATGLNAVQGLAWHGRDLWIANAPDLTIVRDLDGDDVADEYTKVFTDLGNIEHALHGLVWAPDGKLYMSKGNSKGLNVAPNIAPKPFRELFGQSTQLEATKAQTFSAADYKHAYQDPKDDWGIMGGILRCDDMGENLEVFARGFRNPWDIAHDDGFNWLCTDNDQNEGDRVMMPFYGAHFGWNHPWSSDWTGENHLPTAPVSHAVFHGSGTGIVFGSLGEHRGVFFINDWLNKTTFIFNPKWDGALMKCDGGQWVPFITGGKALFRPTDIAFGPDGALWCMSWSRGYGAEFDQAGKMTSEGRVYRIVAKDAKQPDLSFEPMKDRTVKELMSAFNSPLAVHRIDAQDELVRRGKPIQNELGVELERDNLTEAQQTWGIGALGRIAPIMVINDGLLTEDNVNIQTLRSSMRNPKSVTVPDVLRMAATQESARMRFEVVQAIWQTRNTEMVPLLMGIASKETDRLTFYCAWRALRDLASTELLKRMLKDSHAGVRRAALLALLEDSALSRDEVTALTNDTDAETAKLAKSWIENTSGESHAILVKGNGISAANVAPIKGTPPVIIPPGTPTTLDAALAAMKDASAERGRLLALHPQGAGCTACHHIGGRGNHFGPDLTGIGDRAEVRHLLQSMIEPSAVITEGFNSHVVTTKRGTQMGVLLDESGLAVTLGLITGQRTRIQRADITKQETLPISAMPPFHLTLDARQCADIAAWLMTQKAGANPAKKDKKDKTKTTPEPVQVEPVVAGKLRRIHGDAARGFSIEEHESSLSLRHDGKPVAEYVWRHPQVRRPFFIHLRNRAGTQLTRNFPPHKADPQDHADMHPGLWLAFGGINGTDFWRNAGRIEVERVTVQPDGTGFEITSRWLSKDNAEIAHDTTRITARLNGNAITLHWDTQLSSAAHDLTIDGQEEAGLGLRMPPQLSVRDGTGHITTSEGKTDEKQAWGHPAKWWRYGTDTAAIRITPDASSTRTFWSHARDYGALVINPTGTPNEKKKPAGFTVPEGHTLGLIFDISLE